MISSGQPSGTMRSGGLSRAAARSETHHRHSRTAASAAGAGRSTYCSTPTGYPGTLRHGEDRRFADAVPGVDSVPVADDAHVAGRAVGHVVALEGGGGAAALEAGGQRRPRAGDTI